MATSNYHSIDYTKIISDVAICEQLRTYLNKNNEYIIDIVATTVQKFDYISVLFVKTETLMKVINTLYLFTNNGSLICINNSSFKTFPSQQQLPNDHIDYITLICTLLFNKTETEGYFMYFEKENFQSDVPRIHEKMCQIYNTVMHISEEYDLYEHDMNQENELKKLHQKYESQKVCIENISKRMDEVIHEKTIQKATFANADALRNKEMTELKEELTRMQQLNHELDITLNNVKQQCISLQEKNGLLSTKIDELEQQQNKMLYDIEVLEFNLADMESEKKELIKNTDEQIIELKHQIELLSSQIESLTQENERFAQMHKEDIEQIERLTRQLNYVSSNYEEICQQTDNSDEIISTLQKQLDERTRFIEEIQAKHQRQLEVLKASISKLTQMKN